MSICCRLCWQILGIWQIVRYHTFRPAVNRVLIKKSKVVLANGQIGNMFAIIFSDCWKSIPMCREWLSEYHGQDKISHTVCNHTQRVLLVTGKRCLRNSSTEYRVPRKFINFPKRGNDMLNVVFVYLFGFCYNLCFLVVILSLRLFKVG